MAAEKSDDHYIELPDDINPNDLANVIERACESVGLYISHIGSYSRKKYPNSVHWHFKRNAKEPGLIDATFWDIRNLFWLMVRHREPEWVHQIVPTFIHALNREICALRT